MISNEALMEWKKKIVDGQANYFREDPPLYQYLDKYNIFLQAFRAGEITQEQAIEESNKALAQFRNWEYLFDGYRELCDLHQKNLKEQNERLIAIDKAETLEKKFYYACLILADLTGDTGIYNRNVKG